MSADRLKVNKGLGCACKIELVSAIFMEMACPVGGRFQKDGTHMGKISNCRAAMANQQMYEYKDYYFKPLSLVVVCSQHYFNS